MCNAGRRRDEVEAAILRLELIRKEWKKRLDQLSEQPMFLSSLLKNFFKVNGKVNGF